MGNAVAQITGGMLGDPAQNNFSGNYDYAQNQLMANAANQNALANRVQQQAATGASPADIMLRQAMNQNLGQTQALIGSQRGINPGLAARQIANVGANLNQQTASQLAAQRAQEQLNANQLQANIYGNIGNEWTGNQSTAANSTLKQNEMNEAAATGMESGVQSALMGPFGGGGKYKGGEIQGYADGGEAQPLSFFAQQQQPNYLGANTNFSQALAPQQQSPLFNPFSGQNAQAPDKSQAQVAQEPANESAAQVVSDNLKHMGQAVAGPFKSLMGMIGGGGGGGGAPNPMSMMGGAGGDAAAAGGTGEAAGAGGGASSMMSMLPMLAAMLNKGGKVKNMPPLSGEMMAALGKMVPGKAEKKGDHPQNDTIPAVLSPKEIVLPRSVTMAPDAPEKAKKFVEAVLAKNRGKK